MTGRRDSHAVALILGVHVDPWSASRIAAVIVDLRRRRPACLGRDGVEEEAWRKVMREWMEWKEEGMGRRKVWEGERYGKEGMGVEERMGRMKGWGGGRDWKEEGIGRKRRDGRRGDCRRDSGRREEAVVLTGRQNRDDGKTGTYGVCIDPWCPR